MATFFRGGSRQESLEISDFISTSDTLTTEAYIDRGFCDGLAILLETTGTGVLVAVPVLDPRVIPEEPEVIFVEPEVIPEKPEVIPEEPEVIAEEPELLLEPIPLSPPETFPDVWGGVLSLPKVVPSI